MSLEHTTKARDGAQFIRFCALVARYLDGFLKASFGLLRPLAVAKPGKQLAPERVEIRLAPMLVRASDHFNPLGYCSKPFFYASCLVLYFRQRGENMRKDNL